MRIFGIEIRRIRNEARQMVPGGGMWTNIVREAWAGAWQQNVQIDGPRSILAFSAVFACVTGIATDLAKLWVDVMQEDDDGILKKVPKTSPYWTVFKKPNSFQTWFKFFEQWILSLLIHGNAYILKRRNSKGITFEMYVLDPQRVRPAVSPDGSIFYQCNADYLSGLLENVVIPASEIIHDTMNPLWHPLCGISPLYACAVSATMGNRIQSNSTLFFTNSSRPGGILTTPGAIDDETAKQYKARWEENYSGPNAGRTAVLGNGLKYEAIAVPAEQAQLIEQLKWTVEDVARAFGYPLYKLGGPVPSGIPIEAINQAYYSDCLQPFIASAEPLLDDGLNLTALGYCAKFNLENLLRMDQAALIKMLAEGVKGTIYTPNEARSKLNRPAKAGGDALYLQQQNYSLEALAKRDAQENPFSAAPEPKPPAEPAEDDDEEETEETPDVEALLDEIFKGVACPKLPG